MTRRRYEMRLPTNGRLAVVGGTGSGKSLFARGMFINSSGRRVVIDPADDEMTEAEWPEFPTPKGEHWPTTSDVTLDFKHSLTWRCVPSVPGDLEYYDRLYQFLFDTKNVTIWCDEMDDVAPTYQWPNGVRRVIKQGRKRKIAHIACSPSPVGVNPGVWKQSALWAVFQLWWKPDRDRVASSAGIPVREFEQNMNKLHEHGFIWWNVKDHSGFTLADGIPVPGTKSGKQSPDDDDTPAPE